MSDTTVTLSARRVDTETGEVIESSTSPMSQQQFEESVDRLVDDTAVADSDDTDEDAVPGIPIDMSFELLRVDFMAAPLLDKMTEELVDEVETLKWLRNVRTKCFWQREAGEETGGVKIVKGLLKPAFPNTDFLLWVAADYARDASETQVKAALMHQLCHIGITPKGKYALRRHDIMEFRAVASQFGMVTDDLILLGETFRQLHLLPFAHENLQDLRHGGGR